MAAKTLLATEQTYNVVNTDEKKPFNKREWRLKKYSNKQKVQKYEEQKKKTTWKKYCKELKKENVSILPQHPHLSDRGKDKKLGPLQKAQEEFKRIQEERRKEKEAVIKRKQEMKEALNNYRQRKTQKFKKLSKKTARGQPVMKYRLEMLLNKIEKNCKKS